MYERTLRREVAHSTPAARTLPGKGEMVGPWTTDAARALPMGSRFTDSQGCYRQAFIREQVFSFQNPQGDFEGFPLKYFSNFISSKS